jgi:putative ABC transport system permease protein
MTFKLIIHNLYYRPSSTLLGIILLLLSVGIISLLLLIQKQAESKFNNDLKDIDLVVGAKGSPLQLVLSAVYHIDAPTGNIKKSEADKLNANPFIEELIPLAYGDNFQSFRIVGTTPAYIHKYNGVLKEGSVFTRSFEAVIGSNVASQTGLKPGAAFTGTHGLSGEGGEEHGEHAYKVTGILKPTQSVLDNLIITNIESVWLLHEHHEHEVGEHGDEAGEPEEKELTALLIKFRTPLGVLTFPRMINETTNMQAASPALEINRLLGLMGIGVSTLQGIAFAIMAVSGLSVFIALYNRLRERKYELALMRCMGSSPLRIFSIVLAEGLFIALIGFFAGLLLSRAGLFLIGQYTEANYAFGIADFGLIKEEGWLLLAALAVGFLSALPLAIKTCYLDISKTLADA